MTLSLPHLLIGLVTLVFLWVALDWFWNAWRDRALIRRTTRRIRECHLCGKVYREEPSVKISDCPDCSAGNTKRRHRRLA